MALSLACSLPALVIQVQGCLICLGLAMGWVYARTTRQRELERLKGAKLGCSAQSNGICNGNGNGVAHCSGSMERQAPLPGVSIILPVKGIGEHSLENWQTQLESNYRGDHEFIFVVEGQTDPAYTAILQLLEKRNGNISVRVIVAGAATKCSQKIHNQLAGIGAMASNSKYVLFLDDDIRLHPGSIHDLAQIMEDKPEIFLLTGYPFDIPTRKLVSYCLLEYHLPCLIGFSTGGRTTFVWGGCMMMHAADFVNDRYGMVTALRDGGYSDDMTLAAVAGDNGRIIFVPGVAIFLHPLSEDVTLQKYWNYLRRQVFVLETYSSAYNRVQNRILFLTHCWLSWGLVAPYLIGALQLTEAGIGAIRQLLHEGDKQAAPHLQFHRLGIFATLSLLVCTVLAGVALRQMTKSVLELCEALAPNQPRVPLSTYKWPLVWLGMMIGNFLYPICAIYTYMVPHVTWSGIKYVRKDGKVHQVLRLGKDIQDKSCGKQH